MAADKTTTSSDPDDFLDAFTREVNLLAQRILPKELAATEIG